MTTGRRRLAIGLIILGLIAIIYSQALALAGIRVYQRTLAPVAARAGMACRFVPSCSHYAEVVIERDGIVQGGWRAITRIARCHPGTPTGTVDPP